MIATLAHLWRALWMAATRGPRLALLHFLLWELRAWMADIRADFERNGLHDSQHLRECRAQEQALCVQIALLQPQRTEQRQEAA